ncbi:hypothetical protein GGG16DRAFT_117399 [Schizophyllum commune]
MNRTFAYVWRASIAGVKGPSPPPKPDDMNEPQYVDLLWGKGCHYCGSMTRITTSWYARRRYCKECLPVQFKHYEDLSGTIISLVDNGYALSEFIPYIDADASDRHQRFPVDLLRRYSKEFRERKISIQDTDAVDEWVREKILHCKELQRHSTEFAKWEQECQDERKAELERKRDVREQAIVKRLTDMGWGDEIAQLPDGMLGAQKSVRTVQPLTEKAWQALSGNLVQFLKDQRAERFRLQEERALESRHEHLLEVYPEFRLTKPFGTILPGPCDIAKSEPYVSAVKAVPFDQDMPRQAILDILKSLPQSYFDDWRAQCEQELVTYIQKRIEEPISLPMPARTVAEVIGTQTVTRDVLSLATVNFWYGMDGRGITYPSVLMWPRFGLYHYDSSWYPWSTERIRFANVGQLMALRMVELLGKDPHKTTAEEMDRLDPWYYIDKPGSIKDGMHIVYSWRCVFHNFTDGADRYLKLLGEDDTRLARTQLADRDCTQLRFKNKDSLCAHCDARFSDSAELWGHLYSAHDIDYPRWRDFSPGVDVHYTHFMHARLPAPKSSLPIAPRIPRLAAGARIKLLQGDTPWI